MTFLSGAAPRQRARRARHGPGARRCCPGRVTPRRRARLVRRVGRAAGRAAGSTPPASSTAAAEGRLDGLVLLGADPLADFPDRDLARRALAGAGTVIAVDPPHRLVGARPTSCCPPPASASEAGTTTNIEGRVSRLNQKVTPPGTACADWMIAAELASRLGADLGFESIEQIWDEIERLAPSHPGITAARLGSPRGPRRHRGRRRACRASGAHRPPMSADREPGRRTPPRPTATTASPRRPRPAGASAPAAGGRRRLAGHRRGRRRRRRRHEYAPRPRPRRRRPRPQAKAAEARRASRTSRRAVGGARGRPAPAPPPLLRWRPAPTGGPSRRPSTATRCGSSRTRKLYDHGTLVQHSPVAGRAGARRAASTSTPTTSSASASAGGDRCGSPSSRGLAGRARPSPTPACRGASAAWPSTSRATRAADLIDATAVGHRRPGGDRREPRCCGSTRCSPTASTSASSLIVARQGRDRLHLRDGRRDVHGLVRAQGHRRHAEPHRPEPGRPVRPAPDAGRRHQAVLQGRPGARPRRPARLQAGAVPVGRAGLPHVLRSCPSAACSPAATTARSRCSATRRCLQVADPPIGVLFLLAMSSIAVYGVMLAGWSSGSKYPLLGSVRASAQMVSLRGRPGSVGRGRGPDHRLAVHPRHRRRAGRLASSTGTSIATAFVPFVDLLHRRHRRAEPPAVRPGRGRAGARRRVPHRVLLDPLRAVLPGRVHEHGHDVGHHRHAVPRRPAPARSAARSRAGSGRPVWFLAKLFVFLFTFVWLRATLPRFRYDQLMDLGWKRLIPLVARLAPADRRAPRRPTTRAGTAWRRRGVVLVGVARRRRAAARCAAIARPRRAARREPRR